MKKANILCVIPARGGSKGLKNKNIRPILGKPLLVYTIEAASESKLVNKIVVSTDDRKIAYVARKHNIQVIDRPRAYSTDSAPIEKALRHSVEYLRETEGYETDIVVCLQANVPIRKKRQIDNVIKKLISSKADTAATVYSVTQHPQWMKVMGKKGILSPLFPGEKKYRRQELEPRYLLDGAVCAIDGGVLMRNRHTHGSHAYMGRKIVGVIEEKKYATEVDDKKDLNFIEFYFKRRMR